MADSRHEKASLTANWPSKYRAQFWSHRSLPMQVSAVQFTVAILKSPRRIVGFVGILIAAFAVGVVLAVVATIPTYWLLSGLITLGFAVFCIVVPVLSYPYGSAMIDWYRPGTRCVVLVRDGLLMWSLNGHTFQRPVVDVVKIWRFGELSAVAFSNGRSVVIPAPFVPHRTTTGAGPEIIKRWGKPAGEPTFDPAN